MSRLLISLLGPFQVWVNDRLANTNFRTRKERALFAYLAIGEGRQNRREALAELFWPDRPDGYARNNLRQALYGVRRCLEDLEGSFLNIGDEFIRVDTSFAYQLDTQLFSHHIQVALDHTHRLAEACDSCAAHYQAAVDLYRGDFLEDLIVDDSQGFQEWVVFHREQHFRYLLLALRNLGDYYQRQGDLEQAHQFAWRYVNIAPLEEAAHRQLMNLLALSGERSAALEQYKACRQILNDELGVEPSTETQALYERIKTGMALDLDARILDLQLTNMPVQLSPFFGRESELDWLEQRLSERGTRLVNIVGMPGCGKTRLAQQGSLNSLHLFEDGVWFVSTELVESIRELAGAIAQEIGLPYDDQKNFRVQLFRLLRPLKVLIVLDGFDHLVAETDFLIELIKQAPDIKLVVTSRRRLEIRSASVLALGGLSCHAPTQINSSLDVKDSPAAQLFLARAQQNRTSFVLTENNLPNVMSICKQVDGLPLALDLAASRLREFASHQISNEIGRGLDIFETNLQDMPVRHRSLRTAFDQSWRYLSAEEQQLLLKLSIFKQRFSLEEAMAQADATLRSLDGLVKHSLLENPETGYYELHPLVRAYGLDKQSGTMASPHGTRAAAEPGATFATFDPATNLPTRAIYWDRLNHMLSRSSRYQQQAALILLEVVNIDEVDDGAKLDWVWKTVAGRVVSCLRRSDTVARYGRKQFALILESISSPRVTLDIIEKIREALSHPVEVQGEPIQLRAHAGISVYPWDGDQAGLLLERAETALLWAIEQGEFCHLYAASMHRD